MTGQLLAVVAGYLAVVAALALLAACGVPCVPAVRSGLVVAELLLILQALVDVASLLRGHRLDEPATHFGDLAVSLVLLPLLLGLPRRGRPANRPPRADQLVAAIAAGVALVVSVRLHVTWRA